ncbi:MAG: TMEM175 family protein, partial [Terriglobia bacterium]
MKRSSKKLLRQLLALSRLLPVKGCPQNLGPTVQDEAAVAEGRATRSDGAAIHQLVAQTSERLSTDRIGAFSDAVIAVVITIMVLELKAPVSSGLHALWPLWPTAVSYAVSYLAVAIVWVNHHH